MPLSDPDSQAVIEALHTSLDRAGYRDAADQIMRVGSEPLHPDELDEPSEVSAIAWYEASQLEAAELQELGADEMLAEPTPPQRLSAAVKIVDLMVVEPLRMERRARAISARLAVDVADITVGEGEAQTVLGGKASDTSTEALHTWESLLRDLRAALADGEADYR